MTRMMEEEGFGIIARRYRLEYIEPAVMGDVLAVSTWVSDVKRASAIRHNTVRRLQDNTLLARAHVLWAWLNLKNGRLTRIPPHFIKDFAPNIVE
jgi:acyl-CoA thioesterase FadM